MNQEPTLVALYPFDIRNSTFDTPMERSDRLLSIVRELQAQDWQRAEDLAATHDVSLRTIYRDMHALGEAGIPVRAVPGKGYRLYEGYVLPPVFLTTDEAVMVLLGSDYLARHFDARYQTAARAARKKVEAVLPERLQEALGVLQESVRFVPVNAFDHPAEQAVLHQLRQALMKPQAVRFAYRGRNGEERTSTVHPYGLFRRGEAWYLIGLDREAGRVEHFRLDRMARPELLDETFERPAGYRQAYREEEPERDVVVCVLFTPDVARWVQAAPAFYVVETEEAPEGLVVTLRVRREAEVMPWLLSWGAHARVLEPASLRRRLAAEARRIAALYAGEPALV